MAYRCHDPELWPVVTALFDGTVAFYIQARDGIVLPDKASLHLTAIEDADYKEDKIECEL